ncbi:hypothetical protein GCM10018987_52770 [Streptomyces cremeus]
MPCLRSFAVVAAFSQVTLAAARRGSELPPVLDVLVGIGRADAASPLTASTFTFWTAAVGARTSVSHSVGAVAGALEFGRDELAAGDRASRSGSGLLVVHLRRGHELLPFRLVLGEAGRRRRGRLPTSTASAVAEAEAEAEASLATGVGCAFGSSFRNRPAGALRRRTRSSARPVCVLGLMRFLVLFCSLFMAVEGIPPACP